VVVIACDRIESPSSVLILRSMEGESTTTAVWCVLVLGVMTITVHANSCGILDFRSGVSAMDREVALLCEGVEDDEEFARCVEGIDWGGKVYSGPLQWKFSQAIDEAERDRDRTRD